MAREAMSLLTSLLLLLLLHPLVVCSISYRSLHGFMPTAVAVGPGGVVYACDGTISETVFKLSPAGDVLLSLNTESPPLSRPGGVALDSQGKALYIVDAGHSRVVVLDTQSGRQLAEYDLTTAGAAAGYDARGIAVDANGTVYVANATSSILRMARDGSPLPPFAVPMGVVASGPFDVSLDSQGNLWVSDATNLQVVTLTAGGDLLRSVDIRDPGQAMFHGLVVAGNDDVLVAVSSSLQGGAVVRLGNSGREHALYALPQAAPTRLTVNGSGHFFLCDHRRQRVLLLDPTAQQQLAAYDAQLPLLYKPDGVVLDPAGNVWTVDWATCYLVQLSPAGQQLAAISLFDFCVPGTRSVTSLALDAVQGVMYVGSSQLMSGQPLHKLLLNGTQLPFQMDGGRVGRVNGIAVAADGSLWVADTGSGYLASLHSNGSLIRVLTSVQDANDVAVAADGGLFVTSTMSSDVLHLSANGTLLAVFNGTVGQQAQAEKGLAVDAAGNVYLADADNARVVQLGPDGTLVTSFPMPGLTPQRLAVSPDGSQLIVSDDNHNRIIVISQQMTAVRPASPIHRLAAAVSRSAAEAVMANF